jgi:hypothetical protein
MHRFARALAPLGQCTVSPKPPLLCPHVTSLERGQAGFSLASNAGYLKRRARARQRGVSVHFTDVYVYALASIIYCC